MTRYTRIWFLFFCMMLTGIGCTKSKVQQMTTPHKHTNDLINETSPYLLQHAHNPVNWHAWNTDNLAEAKKLNKPLLISIGYSACHWCHVMEHESFEDEEVAAVMNDKFYCIKVDREERPDVDQVYMSAVQIITGSGGWPLNCFALPDGRPFHGGTYFRRDQWLQILVAVHKEFVEHPEKLEDFARRLKAGIVANDEIVVKSDFVSTSENYIKQIDTAVIQWSASFDRVEGGPNRSPKFPIPNNYEMLLRYGHQKGNQVLLDYVHLTLKKMARGGIYDQIEGGFARYSVDNLWKVPHFEKMLYDNGQLLSLYAQAYAQSGDLEYKRLVNQTANFVAESLMDETGAFFSAYDADSEGEEGKYYVWTEGELKKILGDDFEVCKAYYNVNSRGLWEHGNYILLRNGEDGDMAASLNISVDQLFDAVDRINKKLLAVRKLRIPPGLDDKSLTSWNGLMISGFVDAYRATGNERWLKIALKNAKFIDTKQCVYSGPSVNLWHSYKAGRSTIDGFLEDYAHVIHAYMDLYEATFDIEWVNKAILLCDHSINHFYNGDKGFFNFTNHESSDLIHKSVELSDNVIPASNSVMCRNLIWLYKFTGESKYDSLAADMLFKMGPKFQDYPSGYSNWMMAAMDAHDVNYELVGVGKGAIEQTLSILHTYLPNVLLAASNSKSEDYLFKDRFVKGADFFYLCRNNACLKPEENLETVLDKVRVAASAR